MEIIKKYNPLTGLFEYYNIVTHQWVTGNRNEVTSGQMTGGGVIDTLASIASKVTSDTAKKVAKSAAEAALESASKRAGDEAVKYAFEKVRKKPPVVPIDIAKELKETEEIKSPRLYRGGKLKKILKKYNI